MIRRGRCGSCCPTDVILNRVPAFCIAGEIRAFICQNLVIRYLGGKAKPLVAYSLDPVSCTFSLFAEIYRLGVGQGPGTASHYFGPAINALAIILPPAFQGGKSPTPGGGRLPKAGC